VEAVIDKLLFGRIEVDAEKFLVRGKARVLADYLAQISLLPVSGATALLYKWSISTD